MSLNSFGAATQLKVGDKSYKIYDLKAVSGIEKLPYSLKILAENLLRNEDGENITKEQIAQIANWNPDAQPSQEIQYSPARVLMQDFTGVPCIVGRNGIRRVLSLSLNEEETAKFHQSCETLRQVYGELGR